MPKPPLSAPPKQPVAFVELFFDLVFVFAVTQIAAHAAHHLEPWSLLGTVVVFWLVWWSWTQFTWALNAANTDRHEIRLGTLVSTAVAFVMAVSIPRAFGERALWFAASYVLLRALGLGLYHRVASDRPAQLRGVRTFALASAPGLALVIVGGLLPATPRVWTWAVALALDVAAAVIAGRHQEWRLQAGHFAERHGLIVIIALGESLIIAGAGVSAEVEPGTLLLPGILAVAATCLLWWSYFGWVKDVMEEGLEAVPAAGEEALARDAYSLWHFPLVCGIVGLAVGLERILADASRPAPPEVAAALGIGPALFLVASACALRRASGIWPWPRVGLAVATGAGVWGAAPAGPAALLGILCAGVAAILVLEHLRCDPLRCRRAIAEATGDGSPVA